MILQTKLCRWRIIPSIKAVIVDNNSIKCKFGAFKFEIWLIDSNSIFLSIYLPFGHSTFVNLRTVNLMEIRLNKFHTAEKGTGKSHCCNLTTSFRLKGNSPCLLIFYIPSILISHFQNKLTHFRLWGDNNLLCVAVTNQSSGNLRRIQMVCLFVCSLAGHPHPPFISMGFSVSLRVHSPHYVLLDFLLSLPLRPSLFITLHMCIILPLICSSQSFGICLVDQKLTRGWEREGSLRRNAVVNRATQGW